MKKTLSASTTPLLALLALLGISGGFVAYKKIKRSNKLYLEATSDYFKLLAKHEKLGRAYIEISNKLASKERLLYEACQLIEEQKGFIDEWAANEPATKTKISEESENEEQSRR